MKITPFGIIIVCVSILAIFRLLQRLRRDQIGLRSALVWFLLWCGIGLGSVFPDLLTIASQAIQMGNRILFVLLSAVVVLFALLFNMSSRIDRLERNIARLVQELALRDSSRKDGR